MKKCKEIPFSLLPICCCGDHIWLRFCLRFSLLIRVGICWRWMMTTKWRRRCVHEGEDMPTKGKISKCTHELKSWTFLPHMFLMAVYFRFAGETAAKTSKNIIQFIASSPNLHKKPPHFFTKNTAASVAFPKGHMQNPGRLETRVFQGSNIIKHPPGGESIPTNIPPSTWPPALQLQGQSLWWGHHQPSQWHATLDPGKQQVDAKNNNEKVGIREHNIWIYLIIWKKTWEMPCEMIRIQNDCFFL